MKKNHTAGVVVYLVAVILAVAGIYYATLPPISIYSGAFWTFFFFLDAVVFVSYYIIGLITGRIFSDEIRISNGRIGLHSSGGRKNRFVKVQFIITLAVAAFLVIGSLVGSQLFRAKTYSSLITVESGDFATEIAETEYVSDIALMDTASARIIGARTLGTLADLVSQYNVSSNYTQIAMKSSGDEASHPYKVAPLEYASFFKWIQNSSQGIPGYVKVDTVRFSAEFVRLDDYIRYSPSAYFSKDLMRTLRFAYPFDIFGSVCFEVDEEGHPYWVASTMKPNAGLFGAMDVEYVVVLDACTGETQKYLPADAPDWVDIVYYGNLICQKYDYYGMLSGGFINSQFSQRGCTVTTADFGYKIIGNDVYVFTGVTSTSNDEANIGFILSNSRTGEYRFYSVAGAEEYSAMSAAEGSVQQYGYRASFPSLINVGGEATYIMVLKDASGIVKMYSMVNVANYNIVVTSTSQEDVFQKYKNALADNGREISGGELTSEKVTVNEILYITTGGETVAYLKTSGGVFSKPFDESLLFIEPGDSVEISYSAKSPDGVTAAVKVQAE
ncbi:MAG: hypothetical protein ACI4XJ_03825 [Eubacteriales bacterium]